MITEADMPLEEMNAKLKQGYLCVECQSLLTLAWGGSFGINGYILRCGSNINHSGITRHDKKEEERRKEILSMESTVLQAMDTPQMLARVELAKFPKDLTPIEKKLLAQVAITYGFDPLMGEVSIYQGRPFVSIDGRYRKAQETKDFDGISTRPATKQERIDWEIPDGDYFYHSEVFTKSASHPFVGWGRVNQSETKGGQGFKPVEKNPQRMAEKRAEAQALRKAFHIPLPSVEDIGAPEESFVEGELVKATNITFPRPAFLTPEQQQPEASATETGSDGKETGEDAVTAEKQATTIRAEKPARDLTLLKTKTDLYKALHADFGLQPNESLKELGLNSWTDLAISLQDAYNQVAAPRLDILT